MPALRRQPIRYLNLNALTVPLSKPQSQSTILKSCPPVKTLKQWRGTTFEKPVIVELHLHDQIIIPPSGHPKQTFMGQINSVDWVNDDARCKIVGTVAYTPGYEFSFRAIIDFKGDSIRKMRITFFAQADSSKGAHKSSFFISRSSSGTICIMYDEYRDAAEFKEACGYTIEELWYPRVTKIVSIKAKPALYHYYAAATSFKAAEEATERSAVEGTMLHEAVEALLLGKSPTIPDQVAPAVRGFQKFFETTPIEVTPERVERRIVNHDHRYAGTVDAIARIGGKLGVLDIKTSQAIYRDYCLQTSAYMDALKNEFADLETRWILRIDQSQKCTRCGANRRVKGGREKIKIDYRSGLMRTCTHSWGETEGEVELQEFPFWQDDFQAFLGAKKLWEWENEAWLKKIGYL